MQKALGDTFTQTITDVQNAGPGLAPVVTYEYTDADGNSLDVLNDPEFDNANGADLNLYFSWVTADFYNGDDFGNSNPGRGQNIRLRYDDVIANTTDNGDGTFTLNSPVPLPPDFTGDIAVHLNGRLAVETLQGSGVYDRALPAVAVSYPGTPKTEIVESLSLYERELEALTLADHDLDRPIRGAFLRELVEHALAFTVKSAFHLT